MHQNRNHIIQAAPSKITRYCFFQILLHTLYVPRIRLDDKHTSVDRNNLWSAWCWRWPFVESPLTLWQLQAMVCASLPGEPWAPAPLPAPLSAARHSVLRVLVHFHSTWLRSQMKQSRKPIHILNRLSIKNISLLSDFQLQSWFWC